MSGTLATLPEGKLKFALGVDYRGDSFTYHADPNLNPAFNVLPSTMPAGIISPSYDLIGSTGGTQNVREVYGELQVPVLKDAPFAKNVALDLGVRHSQYDLFGGVNAYKADFHWQTIDAVTFRGSFEHAIRAPSLQELYNPTVQAQDAISVDPCEYNSPYRTGPNAAQVAALCRAQGIPASALPTFTYGVSSAPGIIQGNPDLKPETANTYSFGVVLTPEVRCAAGARPRRIGRLLPHQDLRRDRQRRTRCDTLALLQPQRSQSLLLREQFLLPADPARQQRLHLARQGVLAEHRLLYDRRSRHRVALGLRARRSGTAGELGPVQDPVLHLLPARVDGVRSARNHEHELRRRSRRYRHGRCRGRHDHFGSGSPEVEGEHVVRLCHRTGLGGRSLAIHRDHE